MHKISVLIATYNCLKFIEKTIESVLNQTYPNIEIIVIDDFSTDGTAQYLSSLDDSRLTVLVNERNIGYLDTFNRLIKLSTGDYITFVDGDDYIANEKLENQLDFMIRNKLDFCGTQFIKIDERGRELVYSTLPIEKDEIKNAILTGAMPFVGSSIMITREIVENIGGYRYFFSGIPGEDIDWIARIIDKYEGKNMQEHYYYYRFHSNSLTRRVHNTVKARHVRDIIAFLSNQRDNNNGKDSLDDDFISEPLETFLEKLKEQYEKDKFLMARKCSFDHAVNGNYKESFLLIKSILKSDSIINSFKNMKLILCFFILVIFPRSVLLKIMGVLNVKNITSGF
ncbi:glycosyltransferase family 2 protein [Vibrio cholerae]|nr:glycosyltransferase family 2 protein [Vibrio cholerae]EMC3731296.1 glycosyltransferase family 2 protein [Vibrio cholerae]HDG1730344.1 glycosyltransferase family 2 protein [Vibrio cholerae]